MVVACIEAVSRFFSPVSRRSRSSVSRCCCWFPADWSARSRASRVPSVKTIRWITTQVAGTFQGKMILRPYKRINLYHLKNYVRDSFRIIVFFFFFFFLFETSRSASRIRRVNTTTTTTMNRGTCNVMKTVWFPFFLGYVRGTCNVMKTAWFLFFGDTKRAKWETNRAPVQRVFFFFPNYPWKMRVGFRRKTEATSRVIASNVRRKQRLRQKKTDFFEKHTSTWRKRDTHTHTCELIQNQVKWNRIKSICGKIFSLVLNRALETRLYI